MNLYLLLSPKYILQIFGKWDTQLKLIKLQESFIKHNLKAQKVCK